MIEEWRNIPGWPLHEVSNLGRLKSKARWVHRIHPKYGSASHMWRPERILRLQECRHADAEKPTALITRISRFGDGRANTVYVHHLVMFAFIGPRPVGMECCHYDGDPTNNRLENLRWDTPAGNAADKKRHGTARGPTGLCGAEAGSAKLTDAQIVEIMQSPWGRRGIGNKMAQRFGVCNNAIYEVRRRYRNKPHLYEIIKRRVPCTSLAM